ncbi:hypothetical protein [Ferruginibacter albus]|uniref:hypothetical protein n=1 Tax=Ferruginibacter albus TaxID=2875540 RepID=UPI001CC3A370|nr:hypothetical protein [Ferruginibacter albus]UAY52371.1 hypothetical protein K9M53_01445 [Ferruginibacter albus]
MKKLISTLILFFVFISAFAFDNTVKDTSKYPITRAYFHELIDKEQKQCDAADGKQDGMIRATANDEINLQITDAVIRKVDELQDFIEADTGINTNQQKVTYLRFIEQMVREYRAGWRSRQLNPTLAPELVNGFEKMCKANINDQSIAPFFTNLHYEAGKILSEIFKANKGYGDARKALFLKFCALYPEKTLSQIGQYANEPFADSLLAAAALRDPVQLYSYAQAAYSPEGKLIHRSNDPVVKQIALLSKTPRALLYFPFLDNILKGSQSIDSIKKYVGTDERGYDSVGYYKLLVKTEIKYSMRLASGDTPIAMFGPNGLRDMLQRKALEHFITPINNLHEETNLDIRMRALNPLSAEDIYYMIVMGENDIYTSSYKHSFARMLQRMGDRPRTDYLLMSVNMDYFKKFIKMAANFNHLDTFLRLMPSRNSEILMKAFVDNLDKSSSLEDAVDVADSYSSIKNKTLLNNILQNVIANEDRSIEENSNRGKVIYGLLKTIFLSANDSKIDLTKEIGIPSIYSVDHKYLVDDSDRVIQQVFFFGDDDGKTNFKNFIASFSPNDWRITMEKEWATIKSLRGKKVWIFANRPLETDDNLDDSAQIHLSRYLTRNDLYPTVVIHRGHSYWLPRTIDRMPANAKVIVLGSCGGYKNLKQILEICPDAHIISTKEIGKGDINRPILNYLNQTFITGKTLYWQDMWTNLTKLFSTDPNKEVRESWDDYVPPYKNLGAIFIKAYNKKMEGE